MRRLIILWLVVMLLANQVEISQAQQVALLPPAEQKAFFEALSEEEARMLHYDWQFWARPKQIMPTPDGTWDTWLIMAGRGWGKSRTGSEAIKALLLEYGYKHIGLIARTLDDARYTMIEGESGLLSVLPPELPYEYEPGNKRILFPTLGAQVRFFSADKPDSLRGPQYDAIVCDELAAWRYIDAWDQAQFGLRLGRDPIALVLTTPRPIPILKELLEDMRNKNNPQGRILISTGSTKENKNLAPKVRKKLYDKYEGTRLGRQELEAELLMDTPGALWTLGLIEKHRVRIAPKLIRIVVAIDPPGSATGAECGIVAVGISEDGHGYLLEDASMQGTPAEWGRKALEVYAFWEADLIVGEVNNGGDMVEHVVMSSVEQGEQKPGYKSVRASRGKLTRAEPISTLYERGRMHHVGAYAELEDQMSTWVPGDDSPDRMDALVWGFTELMIEEEEEKPKPASRRFKYKWGRRR